MVSPAHLPSSETGSSDTRKITDMWVGFYEAFYRQTLDMNEGSF